MNLIITLSEVVWHQAASLASQIVGGKNLTSAAVQSSNTDKPSSFGYIGSRAHQLSKAVCLPHHYITVIHVSTELAV